MTSELAKLLDGPVAERFGRAVCCDRPLSLIQDVWMYSAGDCQYQIDHPTASALWLAHLLDQCGERGWCVSFDDPDKIVCVFENGSIGVEGTGPTRLEALCRAMLNTESKP